MVRLAALMLSGFLVLGTALQAAAANRAALVIGINDYDAVADLEKAVGDASAMAGKLRELGFDVIDLYNPDRRTLNRAISDFAARLADGDTAFVHFSGHGVEIDGENYLLPADVPQPASGQKNFVKSEAISMSSLIGRVADAGARTRLFVIDACRNNPFETAGVRAIGSTRGLARVEAPAGTFIMYSAGYRQLALDRLGEDDTEPTSVYTRTLLKHLGVPGKSIAEIARDVRGEVETLARQVGHDQRPAYYDELSAEFALLPGGDSTSPPLPAPAAASSPDSNAIELTYWNSIRDSDTPAVFRSYLEQYPDGPFVPLAKLRIEELERSAAGGERQAPAVTPDRADPDPAVELAYWNAIADSDNSAVFRSYLEQYPNGSFAAIARLRIEELAAPKPPAQMAPPVPPQPPANIKPSFDCSKAGTVTEFAICGSPEIAELDREMARLYRLRRNQGGSLGRRARDYQRAWLRSRDACASNIDCLRQRYHQQIEFLTNFSG